MVMPSEKPICASPKNNRANAQLPAGTKNSAALNVTPSTVISANSGFLAPASPTAPRGGENTATTKPATALPKPNQKVLAWSSRSAPQ